MPEMTQEEYQAAYDAEYKRLEEEAATGAKPAATTEAPTPKPEEKVEDAPTQKEPEVTSAPTEEGETVEQLRERLAKAEKAIKDTQAWGTKNAQELAELRRQREQQQHAAQRPAILDQAPDLEEAIRYVAQDPTPKHQAIDQQAQWRDQVNRAHPGIFELPDDDELVVAVSKRLPDLGGKASDPLEFSRVVSEEKLALVGKRFAQEAARQAKKSAMSVPGASAGTTQRRAPENDEKKDVDRVWNMSSADFAKEVAKVKGFT